MVAIENGQGGFLDQDGLLNDLTGRHIGGKPAGVGGVGFLRGTKLRHFHQRDPVGHVPAAGLLGSQLRQAGQGRQRVLPQFDALPGVERGQVWSAEDVVAKRATLGRRVILLVETANWKGTGTALAMAEQDREVTLVTDAPLVMVEMARTAADFPALARLRELGVTLLTEHVMLEWHGNGATVQVNGGKPLRIDGDCLVMATTKVSERWLADEISSATIGDASAARTAAMAIYDGRKWGMGVC